jgi:hypothetical protein
MESVTSRADRGAAAVRAVKASGAASRVAKERAGVDVVPVVAAPAVIAGTALPSRAAAVTSPDMTILRKERLSSSYCCARRAWSRYAALSFQALPFQ